MQLGLLWQFLHLLCVYPQRAHPPPPKPLASGIWNLIGWELTWMKGPLLLDLRQEKRKSEDSQNLNNAGYSVGAEVMAGGQLNPRIVSAPANGVILGVASYPPDMFWTTLEMPYVRGLKEIQWSCSLLDQICNSVYFFFCRLKINNIKEFLANVRLFLNSSWMQTDTWLYLLGLMKSQ